MTRQHEGVAPTMQTEASKTRSLDIRFLVDTERLRELETILREVGESFEYQVKFSDGHALQYHEMEEVLRLPNSNSRSIISVIAGVTGHNKQSAYVVLKDGTTQSSFSPIGDKTPSVPSVEYTINGSQKNVIFIGDKLDEWTAGIRQWYSICDHGLPALILGAGVIFGPIFFWSRVLQHLFSQPFLKAHDWLEGTVIVGLWVGIYWAFKLFPRATFAIGQGARRQQFFTYFRGTVLGAFALSLLASLLANWLTSH